MDPVSDSLQRRAHQSLQQEVVNTMDPESLIGAAVAVACTHQPQAACPILAQPV